MALLGFFIPYKTQAGQVQIVFNIDYDLSQKIQSEILAEYYQQQANQRAEILALAKIAAKGRTHGVDNRCSCVYFAKAITGYNKTVGAARNWPINTKIPLVGEVVVTKESYTGHVIVITAVRPGEIDIVEGNYLHCKATQRTLPLTDPLIKGYWSS